MRHTLRVAAFLVGAAIFGSPSVLAQSTAPTQSAAPPPTPGFFLTTPFPDFTIAAGETADISLTLRNTGLPPQRTSVSVGGLPAGWSSSLKGNGHEITTAIVGENDTQEVDLSVTPPASVIGGTYRFEVDAHAGTQAVALPLSLTVSPEKPASIKLEPTLPALRGTPTTTFDYQIKVTNDSSKDAMFNLAADTPPGFTTTFKHGYDSAEITGVPIKAGENDTVTLEAKANPSIAAGQYPVVFKVQAGSLAAETQLGLEVTGQPELALAGPQERLSGTATAGEAATFPFTLSNNGSAPAQNVKLSASAPSDWTVSFDPDSLPSLDANGTQQVNVKITPSDKAIAGDYVVTVDASADGISQSAEFRVTVNTSTIWGIVGLIVIAIAVIIIVLAVLRYGRR